MLYIDSVHYTHVQEEFSYWLEYFKSRRKNLKITDASEVAYVDQGYVYCHGSCYTFVLFLYYGICDHVEQMFGYLWDIHVLIKVYFAGPISLKVCGNASPCENYSFLWGILAKNVPLVSLKPVPSIKLVWTERRKCGGNLVKAFCKLVVQNMVQATTAWNVTTPIPPSESQYLCNKLSWLCKHTSSLSPCHDVLSTGEIIFPSIMSKDLRRNFRKCIFI